VNDTLEANHATHGGALGLESAGEPPPEFVLLNDTIVRNVAEEGGGLAPAGGSGYPDLQIENTIVAANAGGDCSGAGSTDNTSTADEGGNIDGDGSCFSDGVTGDRTDVAEAALGVAEVASNGGLTESDALLAASPAIGAGVDTPLACPDTDQRGTSRSGLPCDSGAYQFVAPPATPPSSSGLASGGTVKVAGGRAPCRSDRLERLHWRVPAGLQLTHILVAVDGRLYRTLAAGSRRADVSLIGRPKGVAVVTVTGITPAGRRYRTARTLHLCVPAKGGRRAGDPYLRRA
jgi:hypothetical protein